MRRNSCPTVVTANEMPDRSRSQAARSGPLSTTAAVAARRPERSVDSVLEVP